MTENHHITRADIVQAMEHEYNGMLSEAFVHNWKRTDTVVLDQGNNTVEKASLDFHLIEFYVAGSHRYEGRYEMEHGDSLTTELVSGSINYYQPDAEVCQETIGDARLHHIYLDDSIFRETAQSLSKGDPDNHKMLGFHGVFDQQMTQLSHKLLDEARCPSVGSDLRADLISQEIALLMLRRHDADRIKLPTTFSLSTKQLGRVTSYLEDQIGDIGGMDVLAELIGMDVFSFTRAFKASTGISPHQYLIQRRLQRVKELLRGTNDTLADISYATGFSSQPHMTATFTKHMGISPGKWRKMGSGIAVPAPPNC